jgi:TonB family protein
MTQFRLAAMLLAALMTPGRAIAQGAPPVDPAAEAVARSVSPGAVALLLPHVTTPAAVRRLIEALEDPRADVRAVAARVAFTTRHAALVPALGAALDKETNAAAAAEIVRALALIQGTSADDRIARRLAEFDSRATSAWLSIVIRSRPADVWAHLADVRTGGSDAGKALVSLVQAHPKAAESAFAGLPTVPRLAPAYLAYIGALRLTDPLPPWAILAAGLGADATRKPVLQLLVVREAADQQLPAEALEALRAVDQGPDLAWLALYRELARRGRTPAPPRHSQLDTILRVDPTALSEAFLADPILARLDPDEATAFRQLVGPSWAPAAFPAPSNASNRMSKLELTAEPDGSVTRLARPLSAVLMRDLQSILACRPVDGNVVVADVTYRPTGQVRSVVTVRAIDPDSCNHAAAITAALDVAPGAEPIRDGRVDRVVIGMRPSDLSCDRSTAMAEAAPERVGPRIKAPKKTRNMAPVYPPHLIKARVQGVVIAESLITTTGCVVDAVVIRRVNSDLDVSALAAIGEWRYEPARLNGTAVPAIMTVTVSFALQ